MASSLISNTNQVYFASVLAMDNSDMVATFEALVASGLNGFLGCLSDIYEAALEVLARTFQLPVEGLVDLNEVLKDLVFDARSVFSFNGEQLSTYCKKREIKFEFRLLCDILEKVTVKAGSFDAVTHERFFMMTAIYGGIKVNWGRLLFNIFKDMVTPGSRQARGYAVQICILLKNVQNLELGDSKEFPPLKILTAKTIGRYIAINEKIGVEEVEDVSRVRKTPTKKVASKKRSAAVSEAPVVKKKRTSSGKAVSKDKDLAVISVALDATPIQNVDPSSTLPATQPPAPKRKAPKRKLKLPQGSEDEPVAKDTAVGGTVEKEPVLAGANIVDKEMSSADEVDNLPSEIDRMFETGSESEDELEMSASKQPSQISESENRAVETAAYLVEEPLEETEQNQGTEIADAVPTADDESMTLEEHLSMIPDGSSLPSTIGEITKIQFGKSITIRGVNEGDWYKASLSKIPTTAKGKAPLQEKDPIKGNPAKEIFSLICADIELLVQLREKVIDDVDKFFNSFSFNRWAALKIEDIYAKEEQVLTWAETDSTRISLQRRRYILTKYRELLLRKFLEARKINFVPGESTSAIDLKVLAMLSNLHLFVLEELKTEMQAHGLIWEMKCCSRLFEGPNHDRGAVIARSNENIRSSCWIRTMIRIDGSWVIEPCTDYWKPLPRRLIQNEILPQTAYVDTLPPVSDFFNLFKKRCADVCIEAAEFFLFGKLLPVGSLNFCRALTVVEPAQHFAYRRPSVTTWVWSQLCFPGFSAGRGGESADDAPGG
ncbi:Mediator of RNA polymerase II transcription subunit [Dorcoceras hygrometricum]|uniref:Mediator of RNA polymerase II transcription subunit n=1 Tax=Dorcoceras hygrometricum TaxID=472368 RepID=A0A2Z7BBR1_9LAMI|nr:Mediator of RNA polymerase II transcription subunit [Dorcoceras hygrometricum]